MPLDLSILSRFKTTNERLREICTAVAPDPKIPKGETAEEKEKRQKRDERTRLDIAFRQNLEREIRVRIDEGVFRSLKDYQFWAAADLAWDASPVNKATIPLIMYAQGKVNIQSAATAMEGLNGAASCIKRDREGHAYDIDIPKFLECNINLIRSFVTRRLSAQSNIFSDLYPFYKYEARTTGIVGKCRADVLSQRVDIMADQFGLRHHDVQCMRDAFLYGHCVDFTRCAWEVQKQWVIKEVADGLDNKETPETNSDLTAEVVKEGIGWVNPHPSRVFWDNSSPLTDINTDTGPEFIGFWDIVRYRDVMSNPSYYNCDSIGWSTKFWGIGGIYLNYKAYFDSFLTQIKPPSFPQGTQLDPAGENDRKSNIGVYSVDLEDASLLLTNYYRRLIPKSLGCGDYPFPVWIRFIVASDATIVFAEICPSTPAAVLSINENDSKQLNLSVAHELMAYQDQLTNLFNQMLSICQNSAFRAIGINIDALSEVQVNAVREMLKGVNWSSDPLVYEFSLAKLAELGIKPDQVITVTQAKTETALTAIFESMAKLIAMAEKLMAMSPAEQGQPAPREISATEVTQIASTTSSIYSFITTGINEFRSAKKRIIYESLVCCAEADIKCPVMDRYTKETIQKAGFKTIDGMEEGFASPMGLDRHTVIGTKRKLVHDYIFTSRDGSERPANTQAANTLVQLLSQFMNSPPIMAAMGKEKLYEIVNEIFRLSGAGVDLNLELKAGEDNSLGEDQAKKFQQVTEQLAQQVQQLATAVQSDTQDIQKQKQINQSVQQHFDAIAQLGKEVEKLVKSNAHESITINYKDAGPFVKAQIEKAAGLTPDPAHALAPIQPSSAAPPT